MLDVIDMMDTQWGQALLIYCNIGGNGILRQFLCRGIASAAGKRANADSSTEQKGDKFLFHGVFLLSGFLFG